MNPKSAEIANRFDYAASLRFLGPVQDFHVVYETSREATKRGAALPPVRPNHEEITNMGLPAYPGLVTEGGQNDIGYHFFFRNWDSPRLKQVVSRDFIVNITPQGHYKNEVKIYRRPTAAEPINRTPGVMVDVGTTAMPFRTLVFDNPDTATAPSPYYLNTPEKLHITDNGNDTDVANDTVYKVWRTGYPASAQKTPTGSSTLHPDIHFKITEGTVVRYSKIMDFQGIGHVVATTAVDGVTASTETINDQDWAWHLGMEPSNRSIVRGTQTTNVSNTFAANPTSWPTSFFRYHWHPLTTDITTTDEPTTNLAWNASGRLTSAKQGAWKSLFSMEGDALKAESKFNNTRYATTWTEWSNNDRTIKTYTAPDGSVSSQTADVVDWTELTLGNTSGTGLPGLPHGLTRKDGVETKWTWSVGTVSAGLTVGSGLYTGGVLTKGTRQISAWNPRGFTFGSISVITIFGSCATSHTDAPSGGFTDWGAPQEWKDLHTGLSTHITYDGSLNCPGSLNRPKSVTSPLGLTTAYSGYDVFNRPGQVISNGITASNTYTALTTKTTYGGTDVVSDSQSSYSTNLEGTNVTTDRTWGGVNQIQNAVRGASSTSITGNHTLLGESSATLRNGDGSMTSADDTTLAFGGVTGDALSVVNGLLVTKSAVAGQTNTFAETHTDSWGRVHKIVTPSKSGTGSTQTTFDYSLPDNPLKRIITNDPSGRMIRESEAGGTITRSGIDVDGNGILDAPDRYTESVTTVVRQSRLVTTLSVTEGSGMREVMKSDWRPGTGLTITKINGNEETITSTPDYAAKTVKTVSSKGWERTTGINHLGLATSNSLEGTGIATTGLTPEWRADGSLKKVTLNIGGEIHEAEFKEDSTLASLSVPGRGNILGEHSISNGVEKLTVDGRTVERKLDGTETDTSGGDVIGKNEKLAVEGSGLKNTVTPDVGAPTNTTLSAAAAPLSKTYADGSGEAYQYEDELLSSVTLARGGALGLGYSNDGAKDLTSAAWPAMASGSFAIPGIAQGYGYNRSGQIKDLGDPSGVRTFGYLNGRLFSTAYSAGLLKGYEVIRNHDSTGRHIGILLKRDGNTIHSTQEAPNGASDQITNLASGNIIATPQRDGANRITGYIWSDGGSNTVTQTWQRGVGGRIEYTGSDVSGAPSFDYLLDPQTPLESFDVRGRRLKCQTAGGTWTYVYGAAGQLASATHPTLGTFNYNFDLIGRRTDQGPANTTDLLNRTTAWTHSQNKTLTINAHPDARVWFNGVEIPDFTGQYQSVLTAPGLQGGWVPWETLAVLEGAGEGAGNPPANPLASPDAKAEKRGAVWVPPTAETFTFDAAGNRESSSQWDYGWDAKNQLARVRTKNHTTAPQAYDITFTYDSEGRRVKKHVIEYLNGAVVSEKIITFVWDGWDLLYERHQLPSGLTLLERRYLWGPDIADGQAGGAGGLLLIRETKGNTTKEIIPLYDGTGHVVALTDINKNLLASYAYGPFGEKVSATGSKAQSNPWRYQTKYLDEETGLYYFGHRYYDPITGQFTSRDKLGENEDVHLYRMTGNDPVNHVDVLGLEKIPLSSASPELFKLAAGLGMVLEADLEDVNFFIDTDEVDKRLILGQENEHRRILNGNESTLNLILSNIAPDNGRDYNSDPIRMQFGVYRGADGGVYDQFGGRHESFCLVCHDNSDNAAILQKMVLAGNTGWFKASADTIVMAMPFGMASRITKSGGSLLSQARTLKNLGVNQSGRLTFFKGDIVPFQFATEGGDPVFGFVQSNNGRLTSQLFSINNSNPAAATTAFFKFRNQSLNLGRQLGVKSIEIQGGSVGNPKVATLLTRLGFQIKTVPVPDELGGGFQEVFFRVISQ